MPNLPALTAGILLVAYWGRVLRLVCKIRRTTGRSANFAPTEPLGLALRILWYPAVVIWIVHPLISAFRPNLIRPLFVIPAVAWAATVAAALAFAGTLVCWRKMGKSWRMGINPEEKTQLVVTGPYSYVRHPIYSLSSLLMLSTMAIVPTWPMLAVGVVHLSLLQWEASREEVYLLQHHGQSYAEYCRRVGRFFPRSLSGYGSSTLC
ncbi:MAG: methyltransferase family protein [Tepidisphaerales bacterium]